MYNYWTINQFHIHCSLSRFTKKNPPPMNNGNVHHVFFGESEVDEFDDWIEIDLFDDDDDDDDEVVGGWKSKSLIKNDTENL